MIISNKSDNEIHFVAQLEYIELCEDDDLVSINLGNFHFPANIDHDYLELYINQFIWNDDILEAMKYSVDGLHVKQSHNDSKENHFDIFVYMKPEIASWYTMKS